MSIEFAEILGRKLEGVAELSDAQAEALSRHFELLLQWNRKLNLTTVTELNAAVERHYCEAIFLGRSLPAGEHKIVDIGSGGGFPGFPVAVLRPDCPVTLVEAHQRKAVFLREATRGMQNVRVLAQRAETVSEVFDVAVSRAVSYRDLAPVLRQLAGASRLLTGAEEPPPTLGFNWRAVLLPWGESRFLRVSRETRDQDASC